PLCSLCLCGCCISSSYNHRGTENTEVAQRNQVTKKHKKPSETFCARCCESNVSVKQFLQHPGQHQHLRLTSNSWSSNENSSNRASRPLRCSGPRQRCVPRRRVAVVLRAAPQLSNFVRRGPRGLLHPPS